MSELCQSPIPFLGFPLASFFLLYYLPGYMILNSRVRPWLYKDESFKKDIDCGVGFMLCMCKDFIDLGIMIVLYVGVIPIKDPEE